MIEQASLVLGNGNWAVKSDSLLGYKTIDGKYYPREMTVTRATTATRVNASGLVELVPYNLLSYSEQFDNAYWSKNSGTIISNNIISPNGTTTADQFTASAGNAFHYVNLFTALTVSGSNTFSFYVKKSTATWIFFTFRDSAINYFNLDTGAFGTTPDTCISQSVGNGWYRITVNRTDTVANCGIGVAGGNGAAQFLATGTEAIFIWGSQLVEGTEALTYLPTTDRLDIARVDYSIGSPALLVEPQRTNLAFYSQEFSNIYWGSNFTSITKNLLSPSGIVNADTFVNNVGANRSIVRGISVVSGNTYVLSFWIKKISGAFVNSTAIQLSSFGTAVASQTYTNIGTTLTTDWVRYTHTFTATSTNTVFVQLISNEINTIGVWGAQLEAGSYATSYIPTTSASVTRNADVASKTGITSLIGQTEGTIFFDGVINGCQNAFANLINSERNTNTAFSIGYIKASKNLFGQVFDGSSKGLIQGGTFEIGQRFKLAYAYKSGNFALYVNGVLIGTSTNTFTFPSTLDDIFIGDAVTFFNFQESLSNNATALFKTRLTNAELAELTTI